VGAVSETKVPTDDPPLMPPTTKAASPQTTESAGHRPQRRPAATHVTHIFPVPGTDWLLAMVNDVSGCAADEGEPVFRIRADVSQPFATVFRIRADVSQPFATVFRIRAEVSQPFAGISGHPGSHCTACHGALGKLP
jgi:hypothetical protein